MVLYTDMRTSIHSKNYVLATTNDMYLIILIQNFAFQLQQLFSIIGFLGQMVQGALKVHCREDLTGLSLCQQT